MFNIQPNTLYTVSLIYFFGAATAFDLFGTDNAEELLTDALQFVPRIQFTQNHQFFLQN